MTRCNQDGMSPVQRAGRMNLRTISASTKERLEKRVEEHHDWELSRSRGEAKNLKEHLEAEQYGHMLDREAVVMRAKTQRKKDKEPLTQVVTTNEKLNVLFVAALQSTSNKEVERRLHT